MMYNRTMKMVSVAVAGCLAACAQSGGPEMPPIGMANPASQFCEQQGGKSVSRQDEYGNEYGVCVFDDGREADEWAYFRGETQPSKPN